MARVECIVEEIGIENERGVEVASVCVTCTNCGHAVESFGTGEASIRRCLVVMREECPEASSTESGNFYVEE